MKRFLLVLAAFAIVASSEAQAAQRSYYRSNYNSGYRRPQGPLGRLMEMERQKNAMLRQMFFGR